METGGQGAAPGMISSSSQPALDPQVEMARLALSAGIKRSANWFYWIAGLSVVNTLSALSGSNWRFVLGLGITQLADATARDLGSSGRFVALIIDGMAAAFFILMGKFANERQKWAFVLGMIAFGLDTGFSLLFQDWIGAAFHAYVLYVIYRGFALLSKLAVLEQHGTVV